MQYRITLDWDFKNADFVMKHLEKILRHPNRQELLMKETQNGFHVVVWLRKPVTDIMHFVLRVSWGDDMNRIWLDSKRYLKHQPIQVLFNRKRDFYYGRRRNKTK